MAIGDWMKTVQWEANAGHFLAGIAVLTITTLFTHSGLPIGIVEGVFFACVGVKEFWFDLRYESGESIASSAEDAAGYAFGNLVALALVALAQHLGTW
jgi:hypothetical protein